MNFENAIYIGEGDNIETHCNSMLKDLPLGSFLKMRNNLMNNIKSHEDPAKHEKNVIEGTLEYLAPERAIEQPYDTKVDIFSVGVIFYMLLARCHPYEHVIGGNLQTYIKNIKYMESKILRPCMSWVELKGKYLKSMLLWNIF